jgi:hypothetical protein
VCYVEGKVAGDDIGDVPQAGVEEVDLRGGRALLRSENVRRSARAVERVVHIAGDTDAGRTETVVAPGEIDARDVEEAPAGDALEDVALAVAEDDAERLGHAAAAVVGGAAADAEDYLARAEVEGRADKLAGAEGRGLRRIATVGGNERQARGGSHLYHRGLAIAEQPEVGIDRRAERTFDFACLEAPTGHRDESVNRALATISHGDFDDLGAWRGPTNAGSDGRGNISRRQAALERIWGDYDLHAQRRIYSSEPRAAQAFSHWRLVCAHTC